ncbi:MAG: phosphohydrolase [Desulfocapsaceae bacterium]
MKCPGQDMQYWTSEAIYEVSCPKCGKSVEFYKDDTTRSCSHCSHRFVNPRMDFGCAAYCKFAEQCIGTLPEEFVGAQDNLLKDKVAVEMKRYYKTDFKRIGYLSRIARHAEKIGKQEGVNLAVVLCAAYLKDIESDEAESHTTPEKILQNLGAKEEIRTEVCTLIEAHKAGHKDISREAGSLADAASIALLEERNKEQAIDEEQFQHFISKEISTDAGRMVATSVFSHLAIP